MNEWDWTETQSDQATILAYIQRFADEFNLIECYQFDTWVRRAEWDVPARQWVIETDCGETASAQFLVCALGSLSAAHLPDIPGLDDFAGECYHTGRWPHNPTSFSDKRVGVIGTGASGIQVIPELAKEADHLTVFQRTPQYTVPARNRPLSPKVLADVRANWDSIRVGMKTHPGGMPMEVATRSALQDSPEERQLQYEALWEEGSLNFYIGGYADILTNEEANRTMADFVRQKIDQIVDDPGVARKLKPDYLIGTKRPVLDNGYYETFNRDNVSLVDLREDPITRFEKDSILTAHNEHGLDVIVFATGYDAVSGSMLRLNPKGRDGSSMADKWSEGFDNYLGLSVANFPNMFMLQGPGSPGVLYNQPFGSEQQVTWIGNCVSYLRGHGLSFIEPEEEAEQSWARELEALASQTLYPRTDSWYTGANIPNKPRQFSVHLGGPIYFQRLAEIADADYQGFLLQ